jgi:hypothetical protein
VATVGFGAMDIVVLGTGDAFSARNFGSNAPYFADK